MILWEVKYHSDGSFDKWKCRIVFRGDRWINVHHIPTYASSADVKGLLLLLSLAALHHSLAFDQRSMHTHTVSARGTDRHWPRSLVVLRCRALR
jgi:hypothetical protein